MTHALADPACGCRCHLSCGPPLHADTAPAAAALHAADPTTRCPWKETSVSSPQIGDTVALEAKILFDEGRREGTVTAVADDGMVTAEFPQSPYEPMRVTSLPEHFIVVQPVWEKRDAYRIYSRWVKIGDRSSKSVWTAIQEAHAAGRANPSGRTDG